MSFEVRTRCVRVRCVAGCGYVNTVAKRNLSKSERELCYGDTYDDDHAPVTR